MDGLKWKIPVQNGSFAGTPILGNPHLWNCLVGKILTGNHRFSHEDHGAFRFQCSPEPIH